MKHAIVTAAAVLGSLLGIAQTRYWCEWFLDVLNSYWGERTMVNGINALFAKRSTTALAPVGHPNTDHDDHDGLRLLVLVPLGSLLMAGLLVLALSRMVGVPGPASSHSTSGADVDVRADFDSIAGIELR